MIMKGALIHGVETVTYLKRQHVDVNTTLPGVASLDKEGGKASEKSEEEENLRPGNQQRAILPSPTYRAMQGPSQ